MLPPLVSKFIAGTTLNSAIEHSQQLEKNNIGIILNQLGEHYNSRSEVRSAAKKYKQAIQKLSGNAPTAISVKPSQLGLDFNERLFKSYADELVDYGKHHNVFVWFDMEKPRSVNPTLDTYQTLVQRYPGYTGVCLQANLRRTESDLETLAKLDSPSIRLVKGAYRGDRKIISDPKEVDTNYKNLCNSALESFPETGLVAFGTHDDEMISHITEQVSAGEDEPDYEFQMLMGVREDEQKRLAEEHSVSQYAPYGSRWMSYTYRRIRENPKNLLFILKAIRG